MVKRVFRFDTDQDAEIALAEINDDQGFPKVGCTTKTYCDIDELVEGVFTITVDDVTTRVLSDMTPEEIVIPETAEDF